MHAQNYWTKHNINKKLHFLTEYLRHWYLSSQDRLKRLLVPRISVRGKTNDDGITHLFFSKNNFCWSSTFDLSKARSKLFGWINLDLEVLTASSFVSALEPLSVPLPLLSCGKHVPEPCESSTLRFFIDSVYRSEKNCDNLLCPGPLLCSSDELLLFIL